MLRRQFQIKHLMWLVFATAVLFATGLPGTVIVAAFCYSASIIAMGLTYGARVTQILQDTWTQGEEDRSDLTRIEVVARTAICVLSGIVTTFTIIVLGVVLVSMCFRGFFQ